MTLIRSISVLVGAGLFGLAAAGVSSFAAAQEVNGQDRDRFGARVAAAAEARTHVNVTYDPSYQRLAYPGGDVAADRGVCTDLVVRSLRVVGLDLQKRVHEDMRAHFSAYPRLWGLRAPDRNIDHRRAPNLETYFTRIGAKLPQSNQPKDYQPGDIIAWNLRGHAGYLAHIGIVSNEIGPSGWPMVVHNIGAGPQLEDVLFAWPMTGRYRLNGAMLDVDAS